jgi:hypothetical protein
VTFRIQKKHESHPKLSQSQLCCQFRNAMEILVPKSKKKNKRNRTEKLGVECPYLCARRCLGRRMRTILIRGAHVFTQRALRVVCEPLEIGGVLLGQRAGLCVCAGGVGEERKRVRGEGRVRGRGERKGKGRVRREGRERGRGKRGGK